ncbi:MAG: TonB family protein [Dysgonomonas sp.]|nr:TonB family protein [Dysgonomonas sp.]
MKIRSYNILFRFFSYLSDKTDGAPFFVKYKLLLGTLILGVASVSAKGETAGDKPKDTTAKAGNVRSESDSIITIKGKVTDQSGEPIIGAIVLRKGSLNEGVCTDLDGNFTLKVKINDVLVFSYVGYEQKEVKAIDVKGLPIVMLEESVVLCYDVVIISQPFYDDIYRTDRREPRIKKEKVKEIDKVSYSEVQKAPKSIVGNPENFAIWIEKNVKYSEQMLKDKVEGQVLLSFTIDKKGSLKDSKILSSLSPEADTEVLRVLLSRTERWTPGAHYGKKINTVVTIPVRLKLPQ